MILVYENLAIANKTNHPKRGTRNDIGSWKPGNRQQSSIEQSTPKNRALEMILVHETLATVNGTKHPNKVEKKVQEERTQVLA